MTEDQQPQQTNEALPGIQTLLAQLKAATKNRPPRAGYSDEEKAIMDQIRAHGDAAIEPMLAFLENIMAETEELANDPDDDTWYYAYVHVTDLLCELSLTEDHVRRMFVVQHDYDEDEWYREQLNESLAQRGAVVVDPALERLRDRTLDSWHRISVAANLENVAQAHPDLRERIADELIAIMSAITPEEERKGQDEEGVNAFMLMALGETRQEQYLPFVEKMFADGRVDEMVSGLDWVRDTIQGLDPRARMPEIVPGRMDFLTRILTATESSSPGTSSKSGSAGNVQKSDSFETYRAPERPGRNDPCWCGSGKKYKHCHLKEDQRKDREQ